ncbi:MAG: CoA-binding protein [Allorhizobium sp.]
MDHDHYGDAYFARILSDTKTVAVLGASVNDSRPSHWVTGFLLGKGYRVYPVNPLYAGQTILGQTILSHLSDIPEPIDLVDVFRRADQFAAVIDDILSLDRRPAAIWGQLGVRDDEAAQKAEAAGIKVVMDRALVTEYRLVYEKSHPHPVQSARA